MEMVKKQGWTKWGGGRLRLIKEKLDHWYCQACSTEQTKDCPAYMFPLGEDNYIRICSECQNKVYRIRVISFTTLKLIVRPATWVDNRE